MTAPLGDLDVRTFLREYWQKKPCLLRQAFPGFVPELDENDDAAALAGSARLQRNPWTRFAWIEQDGIALLSAAGDEYTCSIATAMLLCAKPSEVSRDLPEDGARLQLVCQLINDGHLFFAQ